MARSISTPRKIWGWREYCVLCGAFVGGVLLLFALFILGLGWGIRHDLKTRRGRLIDAVASPAAQAELLQWSDTQLRKSSIDDRQLPALLATTGVLSVQRNREEQKDWLEFSCGGADNHYGLIVCYSPEPPKHTWPIRKQLADHIWLYDELSF